MTMTQRFILVLAFLIGWNGITHAETKEPKLKEFGYELSVFRSHLECPNYTENIVTGFTCELGGGKYVSFHRDLGTGYVTSISYWATETSWNNCNIGPIDPRVGDYLNTRYFVSAGIGNVNELIDDNEKTGREGETKYTWYKIAYILGECYVVINAKRKIADDLWIK